MIEYSQETIEQLALIYENHGKPYTAKYIRKYGPEEELYGTIFTSADAEKAEARAKKCIEAGKTAKELGLPMNFEGVKDGS